MSTDSDGVAARREAAIGTGICADCARPCDLDKGLCNACRLPRRSRIQENPNPYKSVWNSVEDEEASVIKAVRNNTLFVPTAQIMAERHRSKARYYKERAKHLGTVVGRAALKEAEVHGRMCNSMLEYGEMVNSKKRPKEFRFTVIEESY